MSENKKAFVSTFRIFVSKNPELCQLNLAIYFLGLLKLRWYSFTLKCFCHWILGGQRTFYANAASCNYLILISLIPPSSAVELLAVALTSSG